MSRHTEMGRELSGLSGRLEALATMLSINKTIYGERCQTGNTEVAIAREASDAIHAIGLELALENIKTTPLDAAPELIVKG